jgi:hypothetical protein
MPVDRFIHPKLGHSEKVTALSSDQFRTWTQYILSADDFGVMRYSAITLRDQNAYLAGKPEKQVQKWLEALVACDLIHVFTHQGRSYVFQHDWQTWQKVEYPRATLQPMPLDADLEKCDAATQLLFALHPGGKGKKFVWPSEKSSNGSGKSSKGSETSSTNARADVREVAKGDRLSANGLERGPGETTPMDVWFLELLESYPEHRVTRNHRTEQVFFSALSGYVAGPHIGWGVMVSNLAIAKASHEWRVKGMIPSLEKWLSEGRWLNQMPADAPVAERLSAATQATMTGAAEFIAEAKRGA